MAGPGPWLAPSLPGFGLVTSARLVSFVRACQLCPGPDLLAGLGVPFVGALSAGFPAGPDRMALSAACQLDFLPTRPSTGSIDLSAACRKASIWGWLPGLRDGPGLGWGLTKPFCSLCQLSNPDILGTKDTSSPFVPFVRACALQGRAGADIRLIVRLVPQMIANIGPTGLTSA